MHSIDPTVIEINDALKAMGIGLTHRRLRVESTIVPGTDTPGPRYDHSLRCDVALTVTRNGKATLLYEGEYRMGLAHLTVRRCVVFPRSAATARIIAQATPHHPLPEKAVGILNWAVANIPQRGPVLADVVHCVLLDGTAALAETFEGWCGEYGLSTDSRWAYDTYTRNTQIGIRFRQVLTGDEMAKLAELFANY